MCPPPIVLHSGITLYHAWPRDPIYFLLNEIFVQEVYTRHGFYIPKKSDVVVDVGANIGLFALFLVNQSSATEIRCYEPIPSTFGRLRHNIDTNHLATGVQPTQVAVWNSTCQVKIAEHQCSAQSSASLLLSEESEIVRYILVDCATLTHLLSSDVRPIDLLKIDVEGSEIEVLQGISPPLWKRIRRVVIEYHDESRPELLTTIKTIISCRDFRYFCAKSTNSTGLMWAYK